MERTNRMPLKGRLAELTFGFTAVGIIGYFFDYFLYPMAIYKLGVLKGGLIMMVSSFVVCMAGMKFYDWAKRDLIGIEAIKEIKTYKGTKKIGHLTAWILTKNEPVVFLFLSIKFDPFVTTAYMRHGKFNGMNKRDWTIFMGSLLISNAYWTLACFMGITIFEWALKYMKAAL